MTITDFDKIKVTTMTAVAILNGEIAIEPVFSLLPITKINLKKVSKSSKKIKIPWPGDKHAGCIFSAKFSGINRGIIKTTNDKSFRNSISMDICTSVKNISAKLSKNKIQMTGPNSEALARETAEHIVRHLTNIQEHLDYFAEHPDETKHTFSWFAKETKGDVYTINEETQEIIMLKNGETIKKNIVYDGSGKIRYNFCEVDFKWEPGDSINSENVIVDKNGQPYYRSLTKKERKNGLIDYPIFQLGVTDEKNKISRITLCEDKNIPLDEKGEKIKKILKIPLKVVTVTSVKYPKYVLETLKNTGKIGFPKGIDVRIGNFLMKYIQDYVYHHIFLDFLENLRSIDRVYTAVGSKDTYTAGNSDAGIDNPNTTKLEIKNINTAMINYSYSLGMNVERWRLAELINKHEGFHARFNNTVDHAVTITLPYDKDVSETIKRKGQTTVTWMVYKSGIVTQSGPSPEIMKPMYYKFMNFIEEHRKEITINDGKAFVIKYTKSS